MMSGTSRSCSRQREVIGVNINRAQLPETQYYSNQKLRKKILAENMTYEQTVDWGRTHECSSKKASQVESTTSTDQKVRVGGAGQQAAAPGEVRAGAVQGLSEEELQRWSHV